METEFSRTELLLGKEALQTLAAKRVAVFGVGGVGGFACEALARSGIGTLDLFDKDTVSISNLNRQIIATYDTIDTYKVDAMKNRIMSINKNAVVNTHPVFFLPENAAEYDFSQYDYVIDAVDTVTAKLEIVRSPIELISRSNSVFTRNIPRRSAINNTFPSEGAV